MRGQSCRLTLAIKTESPTSADKYLEIRLLISIHSIFHSNSNLSLQKIQRSLSFEPLLRRDEIQKHHDTVHNTILAGING